MRKSIKWFEMLLLFSVATTTIKSICVLMLVDQILITIVRFYFYFYNNNSSKVKYKNNNKNDEEIEIKYIFSSYIAIIYIYACVSLTSYPSFI